MKTQRSSSGLPDKDRDEIYDVIDNEDIDCDVNADQNYDQNDNQKYDQNDEICDDDEDQEEYERTFPQLSLCQCVQYGGRTPW